MNSPPGADKARTDRIGPCHLAKGLLFNTTTVRAFVDEVDSRVQAFPVLTMANRIYLSIGASVGLRRSMLVVDVAPELMSQASAFRLVERFVAAGMLAEADGGLIPTDRFLRLYESFAENFVANLESQGVSVDEAAGPPADFALWRAANFSYVHSQNAETWLGYRDAELRKMTLFDVTAPETFEWYGGVATTRELLNLRWIEETSHGGVSVSPWIWRTKDGATVLTRCITRGIDIAGAPSIYCLMSVIDRDEMNEMLGATPIGALQ